MGSLTVASLNSANKGVLENVVVYPCSNVASLPTLNKSFIRPEGGRKLLLFTVFSCIEREKKN